MSEPRVVRAEQIPTDIVDTLKQEGEPQGVPGYPARLAQKFIRSNVSRSLLGLSHIVEPVDRVLGIDEEYGVANAFHIGALLGLRVVAACVDNVDMAFSGIALTPKPEVEPDDDKLHIRQLFANELINIGDEGYATVDTTFDQLLEDWEDVLVPKVRYQRFIRSGFGIPIAYLHARYERNYEADLSAMEAAIDAQGGDGFDWESLLQ